MITEKEIRQAVKKYLQLSGWFVFPYFGGTMYCYPGVSDFIACKNGKVIFVEIKSPTGKQSDDQIKFENNVKEKGCEYFLVRSIEDIEKELYNMTGERSLMFA